jgi:hypothetical protein
MLFIGFNPERVQDRQIVYFCAIASLTAGTMSLAALSSR